MTLTAPSLNCVDGFTSDDFRAPLLEVLVWSVCTDGDSPMLLSRKVTRACIQKGASLSEGWRVRQIDEPEESSASYGESWKERDGVATSALWIPDHRPMFHRFSSVAPEMLEVCSSPTKA